MAGQEAHLWCEVQAAARAPTGSMVHLQAMGGVARTVWAADHVPTGGGERPPSVRQHEVPAIAIGSGCHFGLLLPRGLAGVVPADDGGAAATATEAATAAAAERTGRRWWQELPS